MSFRQLMNTITLDDSTRWRSKPWRQLTDDDKAEDRRRRGRGKGGRDGSEMTVGWKRGTVKLLLVCDLADLIYTDFYTCLLSLIIF